MTCASHAITTAYTDSVDAFAVGGFALPLFRSACPFEGIYAAASSSKQIWRRRKERDLRERPRRRPQSGGSSRRRKSHHRPLLLPLHSLPLSHPLTSTRPIAERASGSLPWLLGRPHDQAHMRKYRGSNHPWLPGRREGLPLCRQRARWASWLERPSTFSSIG
jgi:hypothetical protein